MKHICVIGAAAFDITGIPQNLCRLRDSNPGTITETIGGVGHNIAESLRHFDCEVSLITALGSGYRAEMIAADCVRLGIDIGDAFRFDCHSATYMDILDADRDLLTSIADMSVMDRLTPERMAEKLDVINRADAVVLDANLLPETLAYLTANAVPPIFYEPVSGAKAGRIGDNIGKCFAVKPNRMEAATLSGYSCDTVRGAFRAAEWFLSKGVKRTFISLGSDGVVYADADSIGLAEAEKVEVKNTAGAGDYLFAGVISATLEGLPIDRCAALGNHAGAMHIAGLDG